MATTTPVSDRIRVEVQLEPSHREADLAELRATLMETPRRIPSKYFYDQQGSALFEQITELPEYYLTRTERALLESIADELAATTGAEELVELGSGAATKTRILLDAMSRQGNLRLYVPFDVSESEVRRVATELTREYEQLFVHGMVADFTHHLDEIPPGDPRLVILLGSTIGNYRPAEAVNLLQRVCGPMAAGDFFLLGVDLVKEVEQLEAAYNDSAGITAEFNRNILRVVNDLAEADFRPEAYRHVALFDRDNSWVEISLAAESDQSVRLEALDLTLSIAAEEQIHTEISSKYDRPTVEEMLRAGGFRLAEWYTDPDRLFALALAQKSG
ncbi:MAG: L-histidine N(alpha)-methyltransferase [Thermoanaerobaculia bacterium]